MTTPTSGSVADDVKKDFIHALQDAVAHEVLRMREKQQTQARTEREVETNDFKQFSVNFKLSTPVPDDDELAGVLGRDKNKRDGTVANTQREAGKEKGEEKRAQPSPAPVSEPEKWLRLL